MKNEVKRKVFSIKNINELSSRKGHIFLSTNNEKSTLSIHLENFESKSLKIYFAKKNTNCINILYLCSMNIYTKENNSFKLDFNSDNINESKLSINDFDFIFISESQIRKNEIYKIISYSEISNIDFLIDYNEKLNIIDEMFMQKEKIEKFKSEVEAKNIKKTNKQLDIKDYIEADKTTFADKVKKNVHQKFNLVINKVNPEKTNLLEKEKHDINSKLSESDNKIKDSLFSNLNLRMFPFENDNKFDWVKIEINEFRNLEKLERNFINHPFVLSSYKKYKHYILGEFSNEIKLAIPDVYHETHKKVAKEIGLNCFKTCTFKAVQNGDYGYWIYDYNK